MGVSKEQTALNRRAILDAAEHLFRARGVEGVGLVELMKEAGFTQGGFYNHFASKQALANAVVDAALTAEKARLGSDLAQLVENGETPLLRQLDYYFSPGHRDDIARGCAVSAMAPEVARLGEDAQDRFARGLDEAFAAFGALLPQAESLAAGAPGERQRAIGLYCEMVGALILSRAVSAGAPALSAEILAAARSDTLAKLAAQAR